MLKQPLCYLQEYQITYPISQKNMEWSIAVRNITFKKDYYLNSHLYSEQGFFWALFHIH